MIVEERRLELIILGSSASCPAAGDACSGYLIRYGETQILLDCGSGVLSNLMTVTEPSRLSAIVITHFHPDHYIDLVPMRYGLRYSTRQASPPRLFVPPGGAAFLERVGTALRNSPSFFNASFRVAEYDPNRRLEIDDLGLSFQRTTHDEPAWAVAVEANGQRTGRLVFTSDTRDCPELASFARGADLLLCEATYPSGDPDLPSDNHLTSGQAGALAREAAASRLVLTHFWPGFERSQFKSEAEAAFGGPVELASPGLRLSIQASSATKSETRIAP
jgi:ribonuclease BN (tRNA processing enzyme)